MRNTRLLPALLFLTAALAAALPGPAMAEETDTNVTILIEAPDRLLSDHESFSWTTTLTWEEAQALGTDATGLDLLDAAVTAHDSTYTVTWYDFDGDGTEESAFVDEINGVATDFSLILAGHYWALYDNGESSPVGINQILLEPGHEIRLTYTGWPVDT